MELKNGLYEQVINKLINQYLIKFTETREIFVNKIDQAECHKILSQYMAAVIEKSLSYVRGDNPIEKQIKLCNDIINLIATKTQENEFYEYMISDEASLLMGLFNKINTGFSITQSTSIIRPITSISQSSLFTGAKSEPSMVNELKREILSADRIDMLVSFIKWSGLRMIMEELEEFTKDHSLRIITTSYMGATDYKAIEYLLGLPNTEIRISYDAKRTRLHAKSYLFYRDTKFSTAYIGSSNLSNAAISSGLEWNIKITEQDSPDIWRKVQATFETYWNDNEFSTYGSEDKSTLIRALKAEKSNSENQDIYLFDIFPYPYQKEVLDNLEAERKVHGFYRNLVVAATGTGKTIISAFDYKNYCRENPGRRNSLLFVAHREEILKQSLYCFRAILKDQNFGELLVGNHQPQDIKHLFISIQSFNSKALYSATSSDFYDFIIVDEFHHAAAPSYQKLLEHYNPKVLLGLTATPERMDCKDILKHFNYRYAAEIRLYEAIDRKLLCPFQYFGVTDSVDLNTLKWNKGGYDLSELSGVYTENDQRAKLIVRSLRKYVDSIEQVIGLGFCVSVRHAEYMANFFNSSGISAMALHAQSDDTAREHAKKMLTAKQIHFIFVVDLYNEGVDIPEVNTILFLRPTESLTVFLQQLGRGLRLYGSKECLTVLDFIGQANRKYNYEEKFKALMGNTKSSVQREVEEGFLNVPKGCFIQLEKKAKDYILENVRSAINNKISILKKLITLREDTDHDLNLQQFLKYYHMELKDIYPKYSFNRLCVEAGIRENFHNQDEIALVKSIGRLSFINSRRWIQFLLNMLKNANGFDSTSVNESERKMLLMFHYTLWQQTISNYGFTNLEDSLQRLIYNKEMLDEIIQVLNYNFNKIDFVDKEIDLGFNCPLDLYCSYTRDQILAALGHYTEDKKPSQREGVLYLKDKNLDVFFITLNKAEKDYSPSTMYEDYSVNENMFHWQSQSTTAENSTTGQRYINHKKNGGRIVLFVREYKKVAGQASPYTYLGTAEYLSHTGSKPISILWKMHNQIPAFLIKKSNKLVVG